ncbi:MAG TPA: putative LPS assembly protein LptD, partial [Flavisolibacter sp.]|nr:putative LPS assembly protein LptD [Flavisolibacter sp.]
TRRQRHQYNPATKRIDTISDVKGLFIDRQMSFGIGMNTSIYGTFQFKHSRVTAIRHVIRPNINFNYRPNLSRKYYDYVQDSTGRFDYIPQIIASRNLFSSYGYGRFGGITFGVDNNLEMKYHGKKDTTAEGKKVRLIDGFGFTSGYNFLQDSMKLLPFNLYFRTTLFEKISITAQALYNPYQQDTLGRYFNKFVWQGNRFSLGRLNSGSISMSTSFKSKPRDPKKAPTATPINHTTADPNLLADRERLQDYINRNPAEFVDFNIPWSVSLSYSLFFSQQLNTVTRKQKAKFTSNVSFNNSFSLTPKWNFTTNGYFDFNTMQLTMFTMSVSRDMHCWQMSVNVTPIGNYASFNITLNPKSSILQDLRVNRTRTFYNY